MSLNFGDPKDLKRKTMFHDDFLSIGTGDRGSIFDMAASSSATSITASETGVFTKEEAPLYDTKLASQPMSVSLASTRSVVKAPSVGLQSSKIKSSSDYLAISSSKTPQQR